jgi:hypothetical protein
MRGSSPEPLAQFSWSLLRNSWSYILRKKQDSGNRLVRQMQAQDKYFCGPAAKVSFTPVPDVIFATKIETCRMLYGPFYGRPEARRSPQNLRHSNLYFCQARLRTASALVKGDLSPTMTARRGKSLHFR